MSRYIIILIVALFGCLEPFDPEIPDSGTGFLVIDGIITDQPGPYRITISKSSSLIGESEPVTGLTDILIQSENGISENLTESGSGIYQTRLLQGEVGDSYRLSFTYQNQQYQSSWETILPSPTIDNIYFQEETRGTTSLGIDLNGLEFFIDNHIDNDNAQYYKYELEETWIFEVSAPILFDYLGNDSIEQISRQPVDVCWKHANSVRINIATTENLTENILSDHPLGFMSGDQRFTLRYSLLVKQFTINEKEHTFWRSNKESNQELGGLFDRQPAKVSGNITKIDDAGETVLGYFSASGLREERIFVDEDEVSDALKFRLICEGFEILLKEDLGSEYEPLLLEKLARGMLFHEFLYQPGSLQIVGALIVQPNCGDCTLNGGVLEQPEFWGN